MARFHYFPLSLYPTRFHILYPMSISECTMLISWGSHCLHTHLLIYANIFMHVINSRVASGQSVSEG